MQRRLGLTLALAGALSAAAAWAGQATTRDDIWRTIFARPADGAIPGLEGVPNERIVLGRALFSDVRLSADGEHACISCHDPAAGFSNRSPRGTGRDGSPLSRNVPALFNQAWATSFYWDGRASSLEEQARFPILAPNEMGGEFPAILARLRSDERMPALFAKAFSDSDISEENVLSALAAYERTIVSPPTRFDAWVAGRDEALSAEELRGFGIFVGKGGCVACHGGWRFTDDGFHDIGLRSEDPGRRALAGGTPGARAFKTPSLRELLSSAPYMHDGSMASLREVVEHYSGNKETRPSLASNVQRDLRLNEAEKQALVAFLETLSSGSGAAAGDEGGSVRAKPH